MSITPPPVVSSGTPRLREALRAAAFTPDGLLDLLGASAYAALARGETVPAELATREDDGPPAVLTRMFLLRRAVPRAHARAALPGPAWDVALADGWLVPADGDTLRATVDIRPYAGQQEPGPGESPDGDGSPDWWIVSDALGVRPGIARDIVLGVGGASTTLARITVREPVARALDLGTGCGIQALHASRHAAHVTATDLNPRALAMAALTHALSGAPAPELREGSLFEPLGGEAGPADGEAGPADEGYGLIVSNPPFVISPAGHGEGLTYREGGLAGDALSREVIQRSAAHLAPGGWCQTLANWQHVADEDWRERVASWVPPGCHAWIVQREVQDVTEYTELWLRDAGAHRGDPAAYEAQYAAWLQEFAARRTGAVGFGWITLRKTPGPATPSVLAEDWPHAVEQPLGETIRAHFARQDFLRAHDDAALLRARYHLAPGVVQEQLGDPGAEDPEHVVLRQRHGMRRARAMDTVSAGFAGSCDGTLPAGTILDAIARLLGEDPVALRDQAPGWLRPLIEQQFLVPSD